MGSMDFRNLLVGLYNTPLPNSLLGVEQFYDSCVPCRKRLHYCGSGGNPYLHRYIGMVPVKIHIGDKSKVKKQS